MKGLLQPVAYCLIWLVALVATVFIAIVPLAALLAFTFLGSEKRADRALAAVGPTLMQGEELIAQALQQRVFALWHRRAMLAITNSRILTFRRGLFGGFRMQDIQWKDLQDVTIEENVLSALCGSNLGFKHLNRAVGLLAVNGVPSDVAATIYTTAQFHEQAWEEKRRVRGLEEVRAAAGGVVVHTAPPAAAPAATSARPSGRGNRMLDEISQAKELFDAGAVSDAEFQEMKSKILSSV